MTHSAQSQLASAVMVVSGAQDIFAQAAILVGTPVLTMDGELPVEFIAPGDRIITRSGMRKVVAIEVIRVENARVVRICSDSLGIGRPADDMVVSPNQPIAIRDWRAKALYGRAEAMIPAARLCDGEFIRGDIVPEARFVTLRFEGNEVIYAGGMELACTAAAPVAA